MTINLKEILTIRMDPQSYSEQLGYVNADFHKKIYETLADESKKRILIIMPPGHGKSTICTVNFSTWCVGKNPDLRVLVISHTKDFVASFIREITAVMSKPEYKEVYGDLKPHKPHKWSANELIVDREATYKDPTFMALGVQEKIIGRRIDLAVLDDITDQDSANSEKQRETLRLWFKNELMERLEPNARLIIVGTRWNAFDIYGQIIEEETKRREQDKKLWKILHYPAIQKDNSALWKLKFSLPWLYDRKEEIGSLAFEQQYMGNPVAREGSRFKAEWLNYWYESEQDFEGSIPPKFHKLPHRSTLEIHQGVDLAISKEKTASYFVIVTSGIDWSNHSAYILDVFRKRLDFPAQAKQIEASCYAWDPFKIHVEAVYYQNALPQHLIQNLGVNRVVAEKQHRDKELRLRQLEPLFENGTIRLGRTKDQEDLLAEYLQFPYGRYNDCLDALHLSLKPLLEMEIHRTTEPVSKILRDLTEGFD